MRSSRSLSKSRIHLSLSFSKRLIFPINLPSLKFSSSSNKQMSLQRNSHPDLSSCLSDISLPPLLLSEEQDVIEQHSHQKSTYAGTISWSDGYLLLGTPRQLWSLCSQYPTLESFLSALSQPDLPFDRKIVIFSQLPQRGQKHIYLTFDIYNQISSISLL